MVAIQCKPCVVELETVVSVFPFEPWESWFSTFPATTKEVLKRAIQLLDYVLEYVDMDAFIFRQFPQLSYLTHLLILTDALPSPLLQSHIVEFTTHVESLRKQQPLLVIRHEFVAIRLQHHSSILNQIR
jgi:hypothetical protein